MEVLNNLKLTPIIRVLWTCNSGGCSHCAQAKGYTLGEMDRIEAILLFGEPVEWESELQIIIDLLVTDGKPDKYAIVLRTQIIFIVHSLNAFNFNFSECRRQCARVLHAGPQTRRHASTCRSSCLTWTCNSCTGRTCRASARALSSCASRPSIRCALPISIPITSCTSIGLLELE